MATSTYESSAVQIISQREVTMLLGITVITIGSAKAKRKSTDKEKFKTMAIWLSVGLFPYPDFNSLVFFAIGEPALFQTLLDFTILAIIFLL